MRSIRTLLVSALLVTTTTCMAQGFATPLEGTSIMMSKEVHAILLDGTDLVGTVGSCMLNMGQLQSLTLKDAAGEKRKLKAEELSELRVKPTKMDNIGAMLSQPNLQAMITQDFSKSLDREWCYFVQTSPPGKDKKVMMQLLNQMCIRDRAVPGDHPGVHHRGDHLPVDVFAWQCQGGIQRIHGTLPPLAPHSEGARARSHRLGPPHAVGLFHHAHGRWEMGT